MLIFIDESGDPGLKIGRWIIKILLCCARRI
jgi:hypothetical protein